MSKVFKQLQLEIKNMLSPLYFHQKGNLYTKTTETAITVIQLARYGRANDPNIKRVSVYIGKTFVKLQKLHNHHPYLKHVEAISGHYVKMITPSDPSYTSWYDYEEDGQIGRHFDQILKDIMKSIESVNHLETEFDFEKYILSAKPTGHSNFGNEFTLAEIYLVTDRISKAQEMLVEWKKKKGSDPANLDRIEIIESALARFQNRFKCLS